MARACAGTTLRHVVLFSCLMYLVRETQGNFLSAEAGPPPFSVARACARTPPGDFFLLDASVSCGRYNTFSRRRNKARSSSHFLVLPDQLRLPQKNPATRCSRCVVLQQFDQTPSFQVARSLRWQQREFCLRAFRQTVTGPRPMHSGPQGKSDFGVQRADRTSDHLHSLMRTLHSSRWPWSNVLSCLVQVFLESPSVKDRHTIFLPTM